MIKFLDKYDELICGLLLIAFAVFIFFLVSTRRNQIHSEEIKQKNVIQNGKIYTGKVSRHFYSDCVEIVTDRETLILSPIHGPIRIENK